MTKTDIDGVKVDVTDIHEAVAFSLEKREQPCVVYTPNAVMLDACKREARLISLLNRATLSLPDGAGMILAARRKKLQLRQRVAGIDFGEALLASAEKAALRVYLLGAAPGVAMAAAERLQVRFPQLCICGTAHGYFEKEGAENQKLLAHIHACNPDILFVCFGFPIQEEWIDRNLASLTSLRVIAALGGSLDVWAGHVRRAPRMISRMGLEWAWRMAHEPKRLKHLPALLRVAFKK